MVSFGGRCPGRFRAVAVLLALGATLRGQTAPTSPIVPKASAPVGKPAIAPAPKPSSDPKVQPLTGIPRLRALVEAAEKAIKVEGAEDWDAASDRSDEAEILIADWPDSELKNTEALVLLDHLHQVQKLLEEDEPEIMAGAEPGLKVPEEVITLSGEDLRAEQSKVAAAEQGALFDFPIDLNDKVLGLLHTFTTTKRGFMENALSRASQWMPMIRQVFAEEGVPQDLAYLAVIESGFRNEASSRAAAVGMWQFMRSTGRIYGLSGNAWIEERRDPVKATRAAARYLKRLHEVSGDWYLALAGYNAGPLTPERAAQALGTRNYWDIYRSRYLRNETKNYVPSLCAAILIGRFPERYGLNVVQLRPYAFETVDIERQTSLTVIARLSGTDSGTLRELNPELLRSTTPPGHYILRVPPGTGATTARALAKIPSQQLLDFKTYVIRRGDTLARLATRFKVSEDDLMATNNLSRSQFRKGQRIQVPPPAPIAIDDRDLLPKSERAKILGDQPLPPLPGIPGDIPIKPAVLPNGKVIPKPAMASSPTAPPPALAPIITPTHSVSETLNSKPPSDKIPRFYTAQGGDTLASIARAFAVSLGEVERLNPDAFKGLKPGVSVRLPDASTAKIIPSIPSPAVAPPVAPATAPEFHTVKRHETIYAIATRYGVGVSELRRWNHLRSNRVQVGQKLRVAHP